MVSMLSLYIRLPLTLCALTAIGVGTHPSLSSAIELSITLDQAHKAMAAGRKTMEQADSVEDVAAVMKASERAVRVGADPEVEPCGAHAILRTRLYWL
ncbi:MAG: hypothetical protein KC584_02550, partial [Nitrospira sp.]|nr:hypothetical protein [Nitrospira sp.]